MRRGIMSMNDVFRCKNIRGVISVSYDLSFIPFERDIYRGSWA